jgi:hypothetical protein
LERIETSKGGSQYLVSGISICLITGSSQLGDQSGYRARFRNVHQSQALLNQFLLGRKFLASYL